MDKKCGVYPNKTATQQQKYPKDTGEHTVFNNRQHLYDMSHVQSFPMFIILVNE